MRRRNEALAIAGARALVAINKARGVETDERYRRLAETRVSERRRKSTAEYTAELEGRAS